MSVCELLGDDEMVRIGGGTFLMGSDEHYPEEAPARLIHVDGFLIDPTPVTNGQFARFVDVTGFVTFAERAPDAKLYPDADPALLKPGSAVFTPPNRPLPPTDPFQWWRYVVGADWRHPYGPDSSIAGLEDHPVVHLALADTQAYAAWAGKRLPTEAEWECAARGGLNGAPYAWGQELAPGGKMMANFWQGRFPHENLLTDGYFRTSPVGAFPPNGFGLYDMIGNVWEWTLDWYARPERPRSPCCVPQNPRGGTEAASRDPNDPGRNFGRKVLKGGSHLCAENYCRRYRPAARYPQTIDTTTSHIGFRCARSIVRA